MYHLLASKQQAKLIPSFSAIFHPKSTKQPHLQAQILLSSMNDPVRRFPSSGFPCKRGIQTQRFGHRLSDPKVVVEGMENNGKHTLRV